MDAEISGDINNEYYKKLNQQIVQKDNLIKLLQLQIRNLKTSLDSGDNKDVDELKKALEEKSSETEKLQSELEKQKAQFAELEKQKNEQIENLNKILEEQNTSASTDDSATLSEQQRKISEMEQEIDTLKLALASADAELTDAKQELDNKSNEMEKLTTEFQNLAEQQSQADIARNEETKNIENTISELKANAKKAEQEASEAQRVCAEISSQLEKIENERDELRVELAALQTIAANGEANQEENARIAEELSNVKMEVEKLNSAIESKNSEIAKLQTELEEKSNEAFNTLTKSEEEQFTSKIADQLITIQSFQQNISELQDQLIKANNENASLKAELEAKSETEGTASLIPVEGESAIISSFIDFYDGLEAVIGKNPIPELIVLRQKLLDRLITPNEITHMEVISETFDPKCHIATTYFHSDQFPEECIVFEEEKGYTKGDVVVKKAKVWVVQNLYRCSNCGSMQSNYDDRYCPRCGTELRAPNGLSISNLPVYEPNAVTYSKFAERMLEKGNLTEAKRYILAGLEIDSEYVPLLLRYADILTGESNFEKALEIYNKANSIKPDSKVDDKIRSLEIKFNLSKQLKDLNINPELIDTVISKIPTPQK